MGNSVTDDAWFIIIFYVLMPIFAVFVIVIIGLHCYKQRQRKQKFN